jgi:predicted ATP-dependent serine protease
MTVDSYLHDFEEIRRRKESERQAHQEQQAPSRFSYLSIDQLLDLPEPEHRFLLGDILPAAGSSLLIAKPKVGKSTLAQQLAVAVARGGEFFGKGVRQGTVLYHAFEEQNTEVARAFRAATVERGLPGYFHFGDMPEDRWGALNAAVGDYKPTLVVIDTLAYWMAIKDFNDYAQVGDALKPLHRFARTHDTHVMAVHHMGKNGESPLGSTALSANVDTIMMLSETEQGRVLDTRQRYGDALPKTLLAFDKATRTLSLAGTVQDVKRVSFEDEVLGAIGRRTILETELRGILECDKSRLTSTLNALVAANIVVRTGAGVRNSPYMYEVVLAPDENDDYAF